MKKLIFIKTKAPKLGTKPQSNSDEIDERINQLEKKSKLSIFILTRNQKSNLNINGILEITIVANQNKIILKNHLSLLINKITNYLLWLLFIGNLTYLIYNFPTIPEIYFGDVLRINGFTVLIWTLVTFFSAIISSTEKLSERI
jgi:hypothetical protein